jgi:hypothetical protein
MFTTTEGRTEHRIRWEVTDVVRVVIGQRSFRCLRRFVWEEREDGTRDVREAFVAEDGRTVLERGYAGEGEPDFERLEGQTELTIAGAPYRLWHDMLPDHVLLEAVPASPFRRLTRFGRG